jgi:hypothetical protein
LRYVQHPNQSIENFVQQMDIVLGKLAEQNILVLFAGDLNIDMAKCNRNKETADYVETLITNNLMPTVILPTRVTVRTSTLIDHIYYHESKKVH